MFGRTRKVKSEAEERGDLIATCSFYEHERRSVRNKTIVLLLILVLITLFSLTLGYDYRGTATMRHYSVSQVANALWTGVYVGIGHLFGLSYAQNADKIIAATGMYYDEMSRLQFTCIVLLGGMMISVAGMLFQVVFKNAIASPTILGINSGVQIGQVIMIVIFGQAALQMTGSNFLFSFLGGLITLALVLGVGRITSDERGSFEIKNVLLAGVMLSQVFSIIINVVTSSAISATIHDTYLLLGQQQETQVSPLALGVICITAIVTMIPIVSGRFKYNLLVLSDAEAKVGGLNPLKARIFVLACGSLMILTAQSAIGSIAVLSLVIPFLARALYGVEFRKQLLGCVMLGMVIIMGCYVIAALIPFVGTGVKMSVIANVLLIPLFAWIMAMNQKALE